MNTILTTLLIAVSNPGPALIAENPHRDCGVFRGGPTLRQVFTLKNPSATESVRIVAVDGTCGCVRKSLSTDVVLPGQSADLVIEINTLTQPDGANTWRFTLRCSHRNQEFVIDLSMSAQLVRDVLVTPPMMAISTSQKSVQEFVIQDRRTKPLTITACATSSSGVQAEILPVTVAGKTTVRVTIAESLPEGVHDEHVVLTTSDPGYSELRVPVRVTRLSRDAIRAYPEFVEIRLLSEDEPASRVVQFRSTDMKPIRIVRADCSTPGVLLRWSAGEGNVVTLRVEVSPKVTGTSGKTNVQVRFAGEPELTRQISVEWSRD